MHVRMKYSLEYSFLELFGQFCGGDYPGVLATARGDKLPTGKTWEHQELAATI